MRKSLACLLGRHTWVTHVEQGESFKLCAKCGKPPRGTSRQISENDIHWTRYDSETY